MKRQIRLLRFNAVPLLLVLSAPLLSLAAGRGNPEDVRKTKLINRSYSVTAEDKLQIDNQFGDVTVSTWDQNKITVDIEIGARARTEEKAQDILNQIDVREDKGDHLYAFKTKVGEIRSQNGSRHDGGDGDNRTFYIDYVIHMPAGNPLDLHNDFGHTDIPNFTGHVNLTSKYGSLVAGNLASVGAIDVEFGRATIGDITNGKVVFQYNSSSRIGKVNGSVRIISEFSSRVQINVGDVKDLTINESYSGIRMVVDKNVSAQINIHTNFGEFRNESDFTIKEQHEGDDDTGPKFDRDYSGTMNDGKAQIKVKSEFGSLRLTTFGESDNDNDNHYRNRQKNKDKDKDKDKEKDKSEESVS
ncbi:MAG TPA: hypothetical protein VMH27_00285 [Puia sp.]|nr:hypothetical protein [Puia sp.]